MKRRTTRLSAAKSDSDDAATQTAKLPTVRETEKAKALHAGLVSKKRWAFLLGVVLGSLLIFAGLRENSRSQRFSQIEALRSTLASQLQSMFPVSNEFIANFTSFITDSLPTAETSLPGHLLAEQGLRAHYPVFLIPGIVSTNLESWQRGGCSEAYFRKKIWGDLSMASSLILDKECWLKNLMLDPVTGLDPEGCKIRAVQGLDAAQYFVPGYWVFAKLTENLATIGYDSNNMHLAQYDWRLSMMNLEIRDSYFSKLRSNLELSKRTTGRKAVIIAHSMGGLVLHYFLKWVESKKLGHSPGWVDEYIHAVVDLAIPFLGVPKTIPSMLSGEMRDTAQLGWLTSNLLERFFTRSERAVLFRSWGCLTYMLPKGGHMIWGDLDKAPDDLAAVSNRSVGTFFAFRSPDQKNLTVTGALAVLVNYTGQYFQDRLKMHVSLGVNLKDLESELFDNPRFWANPLQSSLPHAPNMKLYSLYGVGKPTERAYVYSSSDDVKIVTFQGLDVVKSQRHGNSTGKFQTRTDRLDGLHIDVEAHLPDEGLISGVQDGDGDGTVSLISLGFMSVSAWRWDGPNPYGKYFNPGKVKIITREYLHEPVPIVQDTRGGAKTADHVDILGNHELTSDILRIVAGQDDEISSQDRILSDMNNIASKVKLDSLELNKEI